MGEETQSLTQTETVESKNKEMETLLALLPQEKPVTTERQRGNQKRRHHQGTCFFGR